MSKVKLSRKKVLSLASQAWKACKQGTEKSFVNKLYPELSEEKRSLLAEKVSKITSWGEAQKVGWKIAWDWKKKHNKFVEAIVNDLEFTKRPVVYHEHVKDWNPSILVKERPVERVIYTISYGRIVITPSLEESLKEASINITWK